jgi:hypothetical protein
MKPPARRAGRLIVLAEDEWRDRERAHRERVGPWVGDRIARRRKGRRHPVDDFLFEYYPYSVAKLLAWHPGHGTALAGEDAARFLQDRHYVRGAEGVQTDLALAGEKIARMRRALEVLRGTAWRPPSHACFGMHEWAMVYGTEPGDVRHAGTRLRLSPAEIRRAVEGVGLRCTHFDAFRFFTDEAAPLNQLTPTRESQPDVEQPGCIHANMDLYKYAMWCAPYLQAELVADCFALARRGRAVDMRASPYDLAALGHAPIRVETPEGRREYVSQQRALAEEGAELRLRLRTAIEALTGERPDAHESRP